MKIANTINMLLLLTSLSIFTNYSSQLDEAENNHAQITKENSNDTSLQKQVEIMYLQTVEDLQAISEIKKTITKPEFQETIQKIDTFLSELKDFLHNLYTDLSKLSPAEQNEKDIKNRCNKFKCLITKNNTDEQAVAEKKYAAQQKHNLELLKRYYTIEKTQQTKHEQGANLGNWIRNSNFLNKKPVTNKVALDALKRFNDKI